MEALLTAQTLHKKFGNFVAVKSIDLEVYPGECLALLGPNGAGKTTTVEMLEGLQKPDQGSIKIFGKTLARERRAIMQDVGVMLQDTQLYKKFTVRETISLFASFFERSLGVDQAIRMVQLEDKADQRLEALSGGQKQRTYLACALVNEPKLLFLDEPTTGLDPQARRMIWSLLSNLKKGDRGILLTTHYMDEAEHLADRIAIVDHGEIIAQDTPENLIEEHCGKQIMSFSFVTELSDAQTKELEQEISWFHQVQSGHEGFEMAVENPVQPIADLQRASAKLGCEIEKLNIRKATLEDVFLKLTGRSIRDA